MDLQSQEKKQITNRYRPGRERNIFLALMVNVMKINSPQYIQGKIKNGFTKVKRRSRLPINIVPEEKEIFF